VGVHLELNGWTLHLLLNASIGKVRTRQIERDEMSLPRTGRMKPLGRKKKDRTFQNGVEFNQRKKMFLEKKAQRCIKEREVYATAKGDGIKRKKELGDQGSEQRNQGECQKTGAFRLSWKGEKEREKWGAVLSHRKNRGFKKTSLGEKRHY